MSDDLIWETPSIGSDESGNGGLFGGCCFACFNLTQENLEIIKQQDWYPYLKQVRDPKDMDYFWIVYLAIKLKKLFKKNKDFLTWNMNVEKWNKIFIEKELDSKQVMWIAHRWIHLNIKDWDKSLHAIDKFIGNDKYLFKKVNWYSKKLLSITDFCSGGEKKYLSISIAAILAKYGYFKQLIEIQMKLAINISNKQNYNHDSSPKQMEFIFDLLTKKGYDREEIFNKYCKIDLVQNYKKNLNNFLNTKSCHEFNYAR